MAAKGEGLGAELVKNMIKEKGEGLIGIVFGTKDINQCSSQLKEMGYSISEISDGEGIDGKTNQIRNWKNLLLPHELTRGLFSFIIEHTNGELPAVDKYSKAVLNKLDHVVINTNDADGFISIYKDVFNIRLALDKVIEHWGRRILFFRLNETTIEVIEEKNEKDSLDTLWGLAWEVDSIEEAHKRLSDQGIDLTPIKKGLKENTLVTTIKSHTHNVPTLLIEHQK